jgi:hypothetical protein
MDEKEYIKNIVVKYALQVESYFTVIFDYYSIDRRNINYTVGNIISDRSSNHRTYIKITPRKIFNRFKNDNDAKDKIEKNIKILFTQLFPTIQYSIKLNVYKYQIDIIIPSQYFISLYDLPEDVMVEILAYTNYKDIVSICQSSAYNEMMCRNQSFWTKMLLKDMSKDDISYVADILNIQNTRFDKIYERYDSIMKRDHATIHIVTFDDLNIADNKLLKRRQKQLDEMIETNIVKTFLFRDADLLLGTYNIDDEVFVEVYMINVVDNKVYILAIDEDMRQYGIANEMFTFPLYTPDYWQDNKLMEIYYPGSSEVSIFSMDNFFSDPAVYAQAGLPIKYYGVGNLGYQDYYQEGQFLILDEKYMLVMDVWDEEKNNQINNYEHILLNEDYEDYTDDKEYYVEDTSFVVNYEVTNKYGVYEDVYGITSIN